MRRAAGWLAIVGCVVAAVLPVVLAFRLERDDAFLAAFVCWAVAGVLRIIGSRLLAGSARHETDEDDRPPVLYLRSFRLDRRDGLRLLGTLFTDNMRMGGKTREEKLVEELRAVGPVIAIGRPGEWAPPLGAARLYVPELIWKESVRLRMRDAALVVVRGAGTEGLLWELTELVATVEPTRIRLHFDTAGDYRRFREWAWPLFPEPLPARWPGDDIVFSESWEPRTVGATPPAGRGDEPPAAAAPMSPSTVAVLGLSSAALGIALGIVASFDASAATWPFVAVTALVVLVLAGVREWIVSVVVEMAAPGVLTVGQPVGRRPDAAEAVVELTTVCSVVPADHMRELLARAGDVEAAWLTRTVLASEPGAADPVVDPLAQRVALAVVGRAELLAVQFANVAVLGVAVLVTAAAADLLAPAGVVIGAVAFGLVAGVFLRRSTRGRISFPYLLDEHAMSDEPDTAAIDRVRNKTVHVTVVPHPGFGRVVAGRVLRFGGLATALHVAVLPIVFFGVLLTMWLWSVDGAGWTTQWVGVSLGIPAAAAVWLAVTWICVRLGTVGVRRGAGVEDVV